MYWSIPHSQMSYKSARIAWKGMIENLIKRSCLHGRQIHPKDREQMKDGIGDLIGLGAEAKK